MKRALFRMACHHRPCANVLYFNDFKKVTTGWVFAFDRTRFTDGMVFETLLSAWCPKHASDIDQKYNLTVTLVGWETPHG